MAPTRRAAVATGIAALVVIAVVSVIVSVAATPARAVTQADLALHGQPPSSLAATFEVSTGGLTLSGRLRVDFTTGEAAGSIDIPGFVSSETIEFVLAPGDLYLSVPNLQSQTHARWVVVPTSVANSRLVPLARFLASAGAHLAAPPRGLGSESVSHESGFTTYHFRNATARVSVPPTVPFRPSGPVNLTTSVTVGAVGQFASGSVTASGANFNYGVAITVVNYDRATVVTRPPASQSAPLTNAIRRQVFGSATGRINELLTREGLASLLTIRVR